MATATLDVAYGTVVPRIVDYDMPEDYSANGRFDIRVAFNIVVTGWHANNTLTDIFLEEGARLGQPTPYRWTGSSPLDFTTAVPDDLSASDWEVLATPPAGPATPGQNGFDDNGQWHGVSGQYFLIQFILPSSHTLCLH